MPDVTVSLEFIWAGIVGVATGTFAIIKLWDRLKNNPISNNAKHIAENHELLESHEEKLKTYHDEVAEIKETINMLLMCELATLDHFITGNSVDNIKVTKKKLEEFIVNK